MSLINITEFSYATIIRNIRCMLKKQNEWSRHNNFPVVFLYKNYTSMVNWYPHTLLLFSAFGKIFALNLMLFFYYNITLIDTYPHRIQYVFFSCQHAKMLFETKKKRCGTQPILSLLIEFHLMTTRIARLKNAQKNMQIIWIDNEIAANRIECENPSKRVKIFHHNVSLECLFCIFLYRLDSIVNSWKKNNEHTDDEK